MIIQSLLEAMKEPAEKEYNGRDRIPNTDIYSSNAVYSDESNIEKLVDKKYLDIIVNHQNK